MKHKHTETPWTVNSGMIETEGTHIPIAYMDRECGNGTIPTERDANAEFICEAVNNYDNMTAIIDRTVELALGGSDDDWLKHRESLIAEAKERVKCIKAKSPAV